MDGAKSLYRRMEPGSGFRFRVGSIDHRKVGEVRTQHRRLNNGTAGGSQPYSHPDDPALRGYPVETLVHPDDYHSRFADTVVEPQVGGLVRSSADTSVETTYYVGEVKA